MAGEDPFQLAREVLDELKGIREEVRQLRADVNGLRQLSPTKAETEIITAEDVVRSMNAPGLS